jgi:hypothetical protein
VGVLTFDQAVLEMGPPDKQAKLTDGTLVAEWVTLRSETYRRGLHTNPGVGSGNWFPHYHETDTPEYSLRLIFAPDGRLKEWKDVIR